MMKNKALQIIENNDKWNTQMNSLLRCEHNEEPFIIKQIDKINAELALIKEMK